MSEAGRRAPARSRTRSAAAAVLEVTSAGSEPSGREALWLAAVERLSETGLAFFDARGRLTRANLAARRLIGLHSASDLSAVGPECLHGPGGEPLPRQRNPLWKALDQGVPVSGAELLWRCPDGEMAHLLVSLDPVPGPGGTEAAARIEPAGGHEVDDGDLGQLRGDSLQQRHLLDLVFNNVNSGVALFDHEDRLMLWNRAFEAIWGVTIPRDGRGPAMDELLGSVRWDFTKAQRAAFSAAMAGARESFAPASFEIEARSAHVHVYTCRLAGGRRLWALRDLTERRQMMVALEQAKEEAEAGRNLLSLVFANVEAAIVVVDGERRLIAYNPTFARLWQLPTEWLDGQPTMDDLRGKLAHEFTPENVRAYYDRFREMREQEAAGAVEMETVDGRFITCYTAPLGDGGRLFSFRDLTHRRRLESSLAARNAELAQALAEQREMLARLEDANRQLEASDRLKTEFLANTSHELRSPLNSVLGYLGLIVDGLYSDDLELAQYAGTAYRSAEHLLAVINDLLDIARIESGRMQILPEPVVLWFAIEEIYESVRPQLGGERVALTIPKPDLGLTVRADPARLRQVLLNVVGNAVKFTPEGCVQVEMGTTDQTAWVRVTDTGIGIPREKLGGVFDKFVQVDGSTARTYGGTGLGLAITKSLVELMGGTIRIDSGGVGQGTVAYLELPLA